MNTSVPTGAAWRKVRRFVSESPAASGAGEFSQVAIELGAERKPSLEVRDNLGDYCEEDYHHEKQNNNPEDSVGQVEPKVL